MSLNCELNEYSLCIYIILRKVFGSSDEEIKWLHPGNGYLYVTLFMHRSQPA